MLPAIWLVRPVKASSQCASMPAAIVAHRGLVANAKLLANPSAGRLVSRLVPLARTGKLGVSFEPARIARDGTVPATRLFSESAS